MSGGAAAAGAECDCSCALPPPGAFGAPLRLACSACCGAGQRLAAAARAELLPRGLLRPRSTRGGVACGRVPPSTERSYTSTEPPPTVIAASGAWVPTDGEPEGTELGEEACWEVPEGAPCALPFVLRGRVVADCAAAPGGGTWCPYDLDAWSSGSGGWGFCAPPHADVAGPESLLDEYARTGVLPRNASEPLPEWDVYVHAGVLPRNASESLPEWEEHGIFPFAGGALTGGPGGDGAVTAQEALNWGTLGSDLPQQRASSSLGPGAIAGVAVGVAAVAVLAGLAGLAAFRRTAQGKRARLADPEKEAAGGGPPGAAGGGGRPGDGSSVAALVRGESDVGSFRSSRAESCAGGKEPLSPLSPVWPHAAPEPPSELYVPSADSASSDADTPLPSRSSTFTDAASEGDPFLDSPLTAVVKAAAAKAAAGLAAAPLVAPSTPPRRWGHPHTPRSWDRWVGPADRV